MSQLLRDYNSLCRTTLVVSGVGRASWKHAAISQKGKNN